MAGVAGQRHDGRGMWAGSEAQGGVHATGAGFWVIEGATATSQYWRVSDIGAAHLASGFQVTYTTAAPSPTPSPTAAPAAATGDPHLQNVHGERCDLMKPGKHVLINIPRNEGVESALLRVEAQANKLGGQCEDIYFTELNVTGSWAYAKQAGGYHFQAEQDTDTTGNKWLAMGKVELKVVHGRTETGLQYLNFYVKHLGQTGFVVGGLLGEEDHSDVSAPTAECVQRMSLMKPRARAHGAASSAAAVAIATFA